MEPAANGTTVDTASCLGRIQGAYNAMSDTSRRIADYIRENPDKVIYMTIVRLADVCEVSEASIVRFCKSLNYNGYNALKISLAAELGMGGNADMQDVSETDDETTILNKVINFEIQTLQSTLQSVDPKSFAQAVNSILYSNRVEFFGHGNMRSILESAHMRFLRIGINSRMGIDSEASLIHATMLRAGDIAIGVSRSGVTKDTIRMMQEARARGATTLCITEYADSPIAKVSDICLTSASREIQFRYLPLLSRVAQEAMLDALIVAVTYKRLDKAVDHIQMTDAMLHPSETT